jgi:pimeloyl-ACP methyl ester carboxylesterase
VDTVRPALGSLDWSRSTNNAAYLTRVARRLTPRLSGGPVALVGHSAGAAAASWMATELLDAGADVRGLVYVDGVESPTRLIERSWPRLAGLPVRAACAPPSRCNRQGRLAEWLSSAPGDVECVVIEGAGHGDVEGPTSAVYRYACGDESSDQARAALLGLVVGWVAELLTRDR